MDGWYRLCSQLKFKCILYAIYLVFLIIIMNFCHVMDVIACWIHLVGDSSGIMYLFFLQVLIEELNIRHYWKLQKLLSYVCYIIFLNIRRGTLTWINSFWRFTEIMTNYLQILWTTRRRMVIAYRLFWKRYVSLN